MSCSSKEVLGTAIDGDAAGGAADDARVLRDTPHILPVPRSGLALLPTVMIRFRRDEGIMVDLSVKTIGTTGDKGRSRCVFWLKSHQLKRLRIQLNSWSLSLSLCLCVCLPTWTIQSLDIIGHCDISIVHSC